MHFSATSGATYENTGQMYAYEINDFSYYINSFNTSIPTAEIDSIVSNVKQIMGKDPSDTQLIES